MASDRNSSRDERYQTKTQPDTNSNLFLKIIDEGVNNIILNLKNALDVKNNNGFDVGTTQATNKAAKKVFEALELLSGNIRSDLGYAAAADADDEISNENINQNLKTNRQNSLQINEEESESSIDTIAHHEYVDKYVDENNDLVANTEITLIENRLKKCVNLEDLYLKKHDEILNIFRFVLNLFDKYKYAIKVILYLLKNLVRPEDKKEFKNAGTGNDIHLGIKLPKPLIKNIDLLLNDQYKIQKVIKTMEPIINDNNFMTTEENLYTAPGNIENTEKPASATPQATASTAS